MRATEKAASAYAEAKNRGQLEAGMEQWAPNGTFDIVPLALCIEGKEPVRDYFAAWLEAFPDYRGQIEGGVFDDHAGAVWWRVTGTMEASFLGFEPTGRRIDVPSVSVFTFHDARITTERMYFDLSALAHQLGIELSLLHSLRPTEDIA